MEVRGHKEKSGWLWHSGLSTRGDGGGVPWGRDLRGRAEAELCSTSPLKEQRMVGLGLETWGEATLRTTMER